MDIYVIKECNLISLIEDIFIIFVEWNDVLSLNN